MQNHFPVITMDENIRRMTKCYRFIDCNAMRCPLDELIRIRVRLSKEKDRCQLGRIARMKLGSGMKTYGLHKTEIAAITRTHGTLQNGIKTILKQNFTRKNFNKIASNESIKKNNP